MSGVPYILKTDTTTHRVKHDPKGTQTQFDKMNNEPTNTTMEQAKNMVSEQAKVVADQAKAMTDDAAHAWETTKVKASEALQTSERYVRDNPGTSVATMFGAGILLGALIGWSVAHESRQTYSDSAHDLLKSLARKLNLD